MLWDFKLFHHSISIQEVRHVLTPWGGDSLIKRGGMLVEHFKLNP